MKTEKTNGGYIATFKDGCGAVLMTKGKTRGEAKRKLYPVIWRLVSIRQSHAKRGLK